MVDAVDRARLEPPRLTPESAADDLSDIAVWLSVGAQVECNHHFNKKIVKVSLNERGAALHVDDFALAEAASVHVLNQFQMTGILPNFLAASVPHALEARRIAFQYLKHKISQEQTGLKQLIMMPGDTGGCGLWRIRLPGSWIRTLRRDTFVTNISDLSIVFDDLMKYDVIVVQRMSDYDQWRTLSALKKAGKKIVYEIDDDLFSIESHNPAYEDYSRDDVKFTVRSCLELADLVLVTTAELAEALGVKDKAFIYPNSVDPSGFSSFKPRENRAPRLFWAGSNTHDEDFRLIIQPLIALMKKREDLELVIMGSVPRTLQKALDEADETLAKRVGVQPFMRPEVYLQSLMGGIKADVGLIPLRDSVFNRSKSTVKALEYTIAGIPIVASNVAPYNLVYSDPKDAFLCDTKQEWTDAIETLLDNPEVGSQLVVAAQRLARERFNINVEADKLEKKLVELVNK